MTARIPLKSRAVHLGTVGWETNGKQFAEGCSTLWKRSRKRPAVKQVCDHPVFDDLIDPYSRRQGQAHGSQPLNFFGRIPEVFRQS